MATPKTIIRKANVTTDLQSAWGIVTIKFPYIIGAKVKNIAEENYFDENGAYVFFPTTPYYEPLDFTVRFAYKGAKDSANTNIAAFIAYISGAEIAIYNEYIGIGRQKCWVADSFQADKFYRDNKKDVLEFDIKFRCNDPMTNVILAV